jgi:hypothetical protein
MRLFKKRSRGFYLCFILLLALAISGSAITYADSGPNTATLKAGSLFLSNPSNQVSLNLNGKNKVVSYTLPITVVDARGSGNGWNLSITSTRFSTSDSKGKLPATASAITGMGVTCNAHSTCKKPTNSISYPVGVPAGNPPPSPVKFFNAGVRTGLGQFLLSMMVNVTIPGDAEAGTYTSTITLAIANGP